MATNLFDLKDKIALLTGATQGLGLGIAKGLGDAGATLVINARNQEKLDKAVEKLNKAGYKTYGYLFDVTDSAAIMENIEKIEKEVGPIDVLVNNAGIMRRGKLEAFSDEDWQAVINANLTGVFKVSKAVVKKMIERKRGKIINMNSMMSELGRKNVGAYAASKGGLKMLTKNMATEWAQHNIQVNGIGPGYFITEITAPLQKDKEFDSFIKSRTPAARWGKPEELQGAAIFLASSASDFVNGHILYVDGGILATL